MEPERTTQLRSTIVELMELSYWLVRLQALVGRGGHDERPKDKIGRTLDRLDAQIYAEIRHGASKATSEIAQTSCRPAPAGPAPSTA